ncbi:uncharacterized protein LOC100322888 [Tribolium castaneum]|uniref:Uncharacterized protein n=1 Tax=Tribolium castaneum TaxID=7070 RepID=D6X3B5_TRICA|nr:uncharacterized protein LOC100322888 [Tribolium castaneum]EFA09775.1 hypothetical protein TcasGA2_TC011917 [Tribolium castaneum]|eukprot:NP_001164117.1 uncharacterized protein LOC100322888 [Tribolium castaneum]
MKNKNFIRFLFGIIIVSLFLIIFRQHKPETIQNIVSTTHQQIRNFKDTFRDVDSKTLAADEKYLTLLGFTDSPRLYPHDIWRNTSLPVIVTYVMEGQESQAVGLINNVGRVLPNNTILVYNLGLGNYGLKTLLNYCNNSRCQALTFSLANFPSHVDEESIRAYRPLVIQDALQRTGAVLFLECGYRFSRHLTHDVIMDLFEKRAKSQGIVTWPMSLKNPVSSLTHKKMFQYFHTDAENFLFLQMVNADVLLIVNTESVHNEIMLPWVKCALTQDCIVPIGAQSAGCRFDKKPQYRYSGCHSYDTSALNIVLGLKFNMDGSRYMFDESEKLFETVELSKAEALLREFEQNITTEGRFMSFDT